MKRLFYIFMLFIAFGTGVAIWAGMGIENVTRGFFLFQDPLNPLFEKIDGMSFFCLFSILLFAYFFIINYLVEITPRYRVMILHRYQSKNHYLSLQIRKGILASGLLTVVAAALFVVSLVLRNLPLNAFRAEDITFLVLDVCNLFLYFCLVSCVSILVVLKKNIVTAMVGVLSVSCILIWLDIAVPWISILTFGEPFSQILGMFVQLLLLLVVNITSYTLLKKADI